ncbi:hypothetical protein ACTZWW_04410 [Salinarimonas sp. NSM]|uniref:hypothetical protein n=1 Tax=Salinarimonas sp. NSM TaxID=3458003 RepID=UPI0040375C09
MIMNAPVNPRAVAGDNSTRFLDMVEADPAVVFRETEVFPGLVAELEAEIAAGAVDLATDKGRKAIASRAARIARYKVAIDKAGKDLGEDHRKAINAVNTVRREVWDSLEAMQHRVRAPLTEWEEAEKARQARIDAVISDLARAAVVPVGATVADVEATIARVAAIEIDPGEFGVNAPLARAEKERALDALRDGKARLEREAAERAELDRLRAEQAERERREAEERAAREAAEREARAAEEARRREEEAARLAADRAAAEERRKAEEAAAAERRAHEEALAAERAERQRLEREAEAKAEAERKAAADEAARQADREHRGRVMGAAKEAIMSTGGVDEDAARKIVLAIAAGSVPHVVIRF